MLSSARVPRTPEGMAIPDPEPSFEERWRRRVEAAVLAGLTLLGLLFVQVRILPKNLWIGLGAAPLLNWLAFQAVSRVVTGRAFGIRIDPLAKAPEEVFDLVFTVGFGLSLVVGGYVIWDS